MRADKTNCLGFLRRELNNRLLVGRLALQTSLQTSAAQVEFTEGLQEV